VDAVPGSTWSPEAFPRVATDQLYLLETQYASKEIPMAGWKDYVTILGASMSVADPNSAFRKLVSMDRNDACRAIAQDLSAKTPEQWRAYELKFILHATAEIHPLRRARAVELYAFIKLHEMECFSGTHGFHTAGDSL
jgi:hypothetical protein